jgi:hypothetical protein
MLFHPTIMIFPGIKSQIFCLSVNRARSKKWGKKEATLNDMTKICGSIYL